MNGRTAVARLRRRWTLQARLLVTMLVMTAIGLIVFGVLGVSLLGRSELARIDAQIDAVAIDMSSSNRPPPPPPDVSDEADADLPSPFRVFFFDKTGASTGLIGDGVAPPALPAMDAASVRARGSEPFTVPDVDGAVQWRVRTNVQVSSPSEPGGGTVAVAMSLDTYHATGRQLRSIELAGGIGVLVVLGVVAAWMVRVGLMPLTRIEHTAQAIAAGDLDRRVAQTDSHTETGRLGTAFNVMLARLSSTLRRLEESEERMRLFVADASHELRTPLTSIRGYAELYRHGGATTPAELERMMGRIESEAVRMGLLVDDLLLLARLDEERPLVLADVDLSAVAGDVVQDAVTRQPERIVRLHLPDGPVRIEADEYRLRQVLTNLVGNCLTHTPATAAIDVAVDRTTAPTSAGVLAESGGSLADSGEFAVIEVRDNGPGIPVEKAPHIFDRFYRVDESRSRAGGSGLGLAIVAAIVTAHGARIQLLDERERGTVFRVHFALGDVVSGPSGRPA
ncbi:sensor histidine kinase [Nocardia sp.]|uniref:sensor histidine kinase n=1 Tax=Nocardia sp. TaxID=1821 RepID=UPI002601F89A|nr:HAMP domain-containing sensor histidine kinase [Nocardia sp.]